MLVLFDQGTPVPLRRALPAHQVETAYERGWSSLENGELLAAAEAAGFDLEYQQNLARRRLAVVVLASTSWPRIQRALPAVAAAVDAAAPGSYQVVAVESPA